MKPYPLISYTLLAVLSREIPHEKSDAPPHTHQGTETPDGPNTLALSFAWNGAITTTNTITMNMPSTIIR